ncbi:MAG: glycoside hydrolase family 92 protein [Lentimicrobiaceae bacterium]|jgi:predicted alpha-1,2-mannosidase|nr:glycoside hydrolase family 92 protein [Lentimicrobiaceae bacterium]MBT3453385.1 glycoside hydrolase family 92 protein [Lentimicrobiaceae bacterium]MBT3818486.1 glycoside hydrolase family 92 protein [Lentimicrobiaceae bacterium]MBT4060854.1 glycoside hydrolase family 92 protein [Lentimicrobiaceae bacterium]MBT4190527.1 glycoside hydrolase family 92 protein [Lentimicrobiaceae bacterium]
MKKLLLFTFILVIFFQVSAQENRKVPVDYIDPLMGTTFARWMLFPGVTMPFGMVKLSPDNQRKGWKAGYEYKINNITGFSHLHSWTMGGLLTMPATGPLKIVPGTETNPDLGYRSRFSHRNEIARAGYYQVFLEDYNINAELTSTTRAGFQRYTFPKAKDARIIIDLKISTEYSYEIFAARITKVSDTEIEGYSVQQSLRGANYNEFILHFVIRFDTPFKSFNGWVREEIQENTDDIILIYGDEDVGAFVTFETHEGEQILMQSGVSLVSVEQARLNMETELDPFNWNFDKVVKHNQNTWNNLLGTIQVSGGSETDTKKFYTNMYRAYASRTIWSDVNGKYRDMYEKVQQLEDSSDVVYGGDAFWNTFWNLNQLWTLQHPEIANSWVRSLLEIYDKGGWLPKGPTGIEYSSIMVASHEIPLIVSAFQKGIRNYDVDKAYTAIRHNQMEQGKPHPGGGLVGNRHLESYIKYGFVPNEEGPVSNTLEYAYDDWTVGQMAKALGNESDFKTFTKRAFNYKNVFNEKVGYVWMKNSDGSWKENFSPYGYSVFLGPGFVEGNAWQYTWFVPHDQKGLLNLLGKETYISRLEEGFQKSLPHRFNSEHLNENGLIGVGILPINHGNQPNMEAAYLFNYAGAPWLTQKWVREIMYGFYGDSIDAWPGDEDQGQMGAWYVMSAMGLFEMDGGASINPIYEIGSPIFEKIMIQLDSNYYSGGIFVIEAKNVSRENKYIQWAKLNGEKLTKPWFYHSQLVGGGKLELKMGNKPNKKWGSKPEDAPPSMSSILTQGEINEIMAYDKFDEDMEAWNKAMRAYYYQKKEHFELLPDTENEIIFLGNSITDGCEWAELFQNPNIKNRGIGGDDTDGVLERLDEIISSKPSKIFIMIGTNDMAYGKTVDYVVSNYTKIIDSIQIICPDTKIYIQSVLPVDDAIHYTRSTSDIMQINTHLEKLSAEKSIEYIELFSIFSNDDNKLNPDYSLDGLHLNGKGYQVWKEAIQKYVEE